MSSIRYCVRLTIGRLTKGKSTGLGTRGISRRYLVAVPIFAMVALQMTQDWHTNTRSEIIHAALAPYTAYVEKDPDGLCGAFVPRVARNIGGSPDHSSCVHRVTSLFRNNEALKSFPGAPLVRTFLVENVTWRGDRGKATISYYVKGGRERFWLAFIRGDSRWRVSTAPIFAVVGGCSIYIERRRCSRAGNILFLESLRPCYLASHE
jgi:hypothetical protein